MTMSVRDPVSDPEVRRSGFGGSDVGALAGVSRFRTRHDVDLEKMGLAAPLIETEAMRWGKLLEAPVLREYVVQSGHRIMTRRNEHGHQLTRRHPKYPWMFCHIDAETIRTPKRGVDAKTTNPYHNDDWGEPGTDQVPGEYALQMQHYMAITGWDVFDIPVLVGGQKFRIYTVERDPELVEFLIDLEAQEWARIQRGEFAAVDGSEGAERSLAARFPKADPLLELEASPDQAEWARQVLVAKAEKVEAEKRIDLYSQRIKESMASAGVLVGTGCRVTWANVAGAVRWKDVAEGLRPSVDSATWQNVLAGARSGDSRRLSVTAREEG